MLIEVYRRVQQIPVIQTGVAAGYRWSVEVWSLSDPSHMEIRVFAPRLMRHQTAKYQYPLNSIQVQWELPPLRPGAFPNSVYVFENDVKSLRTPVDGWFEIEYASRVIRTIPLLATAENSEWRVNSGCWPGVYSRRDRTVTTDWATAYANMPAVASHICRELRRVEEAVCSLR